MATENGTRSGVELREQRRERNAREIQQAALALFAERGYADVTVEDITHEAGISVRTFFRYFASKDHLLVAEAGSRIEVIHRSLAQQDDEIDAWEALRNAVLDSRRARTVWGATPRSGPTSPRRRPHSSPR